MISENITNIKKFMSLLLINNTFDKFLATDVTITTYNTFHIDGHINAKYYSNGEYEENGSPVLSSWETLRPFCFELIKGNKTPIYFKIILCFSKPSIETLIKKNNIDIDPQIVNDLFLNLKYENGILTYTTGTSLNVFSLDKTLEKAFDSYISDFISTLF